MRICVVGGGLAGALLAWRLGRAGRPAEVDLLLGEARDRDATAVSGGAVRAYETDPRQRRLAIASLVELLASPTLRKWGDFRSAEFVYLRAPGDDLPSGLADLERELPGAARLQCAAELAAQGFADLPAGAVAVREERAGYLALGRFREAVLADSARCGVGARTAPLTGLTGRPTGGFACLAAGARREYDRVVLATGGWTGAVLAANGLPADEYRTKSIQYTVYRTGARRPPAFADEFTGLYARPDGADRLLLGLATSDWGVAPDQPPVTPDLHERAARLARSRWPRLRLGEPVRTVGGVDCYGADPVLRLRPVSGAGPGLFTFTGGAGGSAKTALAASREAAHQLLDPDNTPLLPLGPREGQS